MTKLEILTKKAIKKWCKDNDIEVNCVRHIYPRAYIIAKTAPSCIVVATPWQDSENHIRDKKYSSFNTIRTFDDSLNVGDWCGVAYVCRIGIQDNVAIPSVIA